MKSTRPLLLKFDISRKKSDHSSNLNHTETLLFKLLDARNCFKSWKYDVI